jgi:hypothetical protein
VRSEYFEMLRRIRLLRTELLPSTSSTASYTNGDVLRMLGFRLLTHAELEGFFEFCAEDLVDHYSTRLTNGVLSGRMRRHLVLHSQMVDHYPPRSLTFPVGIDSSQDKAIKGILRSHQNIIEGNNGISEKDVLKLFIPLGCETTFYDHSWLASLNALARARGEVAHNSALTPSASAQPTPENERSRLVEPLWGTRALIAELLRLKALA